MTVTTEVIASPIGASVNWVEHLLLGSVATGVATIAVAVVGLATLTGRLGLRRGVCVIVGCFIITGAPSITQRLSTLARADPAPDAITSPAILPIAPPQASAGYDPYAGAGLAVRPTSKEMLRDPVSANRSPRLLPDQNRRLDAPRVTR